MMKFFCEYCGARIDAQIDDCCPNCKAPYTKNKTFIEMETKKKENQEFADQVKKDVYKQFKSGLKASKVISIFVFPFIFIVFILVFVGIISTFIGVSKNHNSNFSDDDSNFSDVIDGVNKSSFNSVLEMYTGEEYGHQVKYLLEEVIIDNKKYANHNIYVIYNEYNTNDVNQITILKQSLEDWGKYEVSADYDDNGYINKIMITFIK